MPLTNRLTPFGEIVAVPARGTLMGNRGVLHDAERRIVRDWQVRRWIACRLQFRGRQREVMTPGAYTELFFLDEATALADGHRPCAECRHAEYLQFQAGWRSTHPGMPASAAAMDAALHVERRLGPWRKRTYEAEIERLPDGTFVAVDGVAWLLHAGTLHAWSSDGYLDRRPRPAGGRVVVLTPPSVVGVLSAGYRPEVHPSASLRWQTSRMLKRKS